MKIILAAATLALLPMGAFADGHIEGRIGAAVTVLDKNKNADILVNGPRIIGDNGRGNGNEPFDVGEIECPDHDPQNPCDQDGD